MSTTIRTLKFTGKPCVLSGCASGWEGYGPRGLCPMHRRKRLTPEERDQIRERHAAGVSRQDLAWDFECTKQSIGEIVNGLR